MWSFCQKITVVAVIVLVVAQIKHNLHSADFWPPPGQEWQTCLSRKSPRSPHSHSPSLDLNLTRRPRPHCTAEVEGSGCAERTNTLPNASFSPHRTLAAQRTLGIAPRGGALATLWGTRTDWTSLKEPCGAREHCNGKRTATKAARSTPVCPFEQL